MARIHAITISFSFSISTFKNSGLIFNLVFQFKWSKINEISMLHNLLAFLKDVYPLSTMTSMAFCN
jgi:hypothetical protein